MGRLILLQKSAYLVKKKFKTKCKRGYDLSAVFVWSADKTDVSNVIFSNLQRKMRKKCKKVPVTLYFCYICLNRE